MGGTSVMRLVTDWPPRIAAPSWSGWADRTVTGRGYSRPLLGHGHPVSWLPYELPAGDDRQVSSQDRRSVKLRVRPPPAGTHQCHRATSAGSGMMLTVKLVWTVRCSTSRSFALARSARRCCTNRHWPARCQSTRSSHADAIRHWSSEGGHPIQDRTAEDDLTPLPGWTPGAKAIADDGRVAEERVLHPALTMVP